MLKRIVLSCLPYRYRVELNFLGPKRFIQYFIAQRIFRINSSVPWPVHWSSIVVNPKNIKKSDALPFLGHHPACYIQANEEIIVGKNLRYGPNVHIISANHSLDNYAQHNRGSAIIIGDNCWIGSGSIILSGAELGDHVVVAAGSVVNKKFPSNVLIGGTPARVLKELNEYIGDPNWKLLK